MDEKITKPQMIFRDEYEKEFNGVKQSLKGRCFWHCSFCNCDINLEAIGKAAIFAHHATQKHKNSARRINSNQFVKNFFMSQSKPTTLDYKAAAAESTWAFHTVNNNNIYLPNAQT